MGLAVTGEAQYGDAVRRLFPRGDYWDKQFADPQSDTSLFAKAKVSELVRFRGRMSALLDESKPETTAELIVDWERVLLEAEFPNLDLNQRRIQLKSRQDMRLDKTKLREIAAIFGLSIKGVGIPYHPCFFGFAKFAQERHGSFTTLSVVRIAAAETGFEAKHRRNIIAELERHRFARMRFALGRLGYFPIGKAREIVYRNIRRGCFGYGRFAQYRLVPFPVGEARRIAEGRLDTNRVTKLFFGQSRLAFFSGRFDPHIALGLNFLDGYITDILRKADFYKRFERAILDEYFIRAKPYHEFETAVRNELIASQIPIFCYEGE
jgi:hypothetical protein